MEQIVLMYHNISLNSARIAFDEWQPEYDVSYENFLLHTSIFQEKISRVILTFDDGYQSVYESVLPLKEHYGLNCACFVTTAAIGRPGMLQRTQIRELCERGVEIGAHSHTHAFLDNLGPHELARELRDPKHILEDITGREVQSLSAPGGRFDQAALEYASSQGYRAVHTSIPGVRNARQNGAASIELVPRWVVTARSSTRELEHIVNGTSWYIWARRSLYYIGRFGKRLLGNKLYHRAWQNLQRIKPSSN